MSCISGRLIILYLCKYLVIICNDIDTLHLHCKVVLLSINPCKPLQLHICYTSGVFWFLFLFTVFFYCLASNGHCVSIVILWRRWVLPYAILRNFVTTMYLSSLGVFIFYKDHVTVLVNSM